MSSFAPLADGPTALAPNDALGRVASAEGCAQELLQWLGHGPGGMKPMLAVSRLWRAAARSPIAWRDIVLSHDPYEMDDRGFAQLLRAAALATVDGAAPTKAPPALALACVRRLDLKGLINLTDESLRLVAASCPRLAALELDGTEGFPLRATTDAGVAAVLGALGGAGGSLERLVVRRALRFTGRAFVAPAAADAPAADAPASSPAPAPAAVESATGDAAAAAAPEPRKRRRFE